MSAKIGALSPTSLVDQCVYKDDEQDNFASYFEVYFMEKMRFLITPGIDW